MPHLITSHKGPYINGTGNYTVDINGTGNFTVDINGTGNYTVA